MDQYTIATYGLDPLDQTRIRLACSLLLADNMRINLVDEIDNNDLSIFGLDNFDGKKKWEQNKANNQSVLLISRHYQGGAPWLAHGTTVSEFRKFIHQLIVIKRHEGSVDHDLSDYPLLLKEILNPTFATEKKFRHRSMECLVDAATRSIYLKDNIEILDFMAIVRAKGWVSIPINESEQDCLPNYFRSRVSFESVIFGLSGADCLKVSKISQDHYYKLKCWPELLAETIHSAQLLAIARLHTRFWKPQNLADVCHLSLSTTLGLLTAAFECDLLVVENKPPFVENEKTVHNKKDTGFLVWVARRFGLRT